MAIHRFSADDVRQVRLMRPRQYPIERLKLKVKTLRQFVSCLDWDMLLSRGCVKSKDGIASLLSKLPF